MCHLQGASKCSNCSPFSQSTYTATAAIAANSAIATIEIVPTTRAQPLSQATNEIVPTTRDQPLTTTHSHLGEVPAVRSHPTTNVPGILMTEPTNTIVHSSRSSQLMSGERHISSTSDDTAIIKQILSTHAPDGREFDVKPLLIIIQDIVSCANRTSHAVGGQSHDHINTWEEKAIYSGYSDELEFLASLIKKTNNEIINECSAGGDAHLITIALFRSLSSYSWEAKATIAFAAFAVSYAEFWLVAQLYTTNPLAKSVVVLKDLPEIMEPTEALKQKFEAVNNLMKAILDVTECIIKFKELFSQPEMESAAAHILIAVYWTVRCIVTCSITLLNLIALGHKYVAEALELNSLAHKLAGIKKDLERQMALINQKIEEMSQNDAFLELILLSETPHIDNMKILRALIYGKEDQLPLYDGTQKRSLFPYLHLNTTSFFLHLASLDILRREHVLLFISDLELSYKELEILRLTYVESRQHPTRVESQYEVVWLPVVDRLSPWQEEKQKQFELVQNSMPWYSVAHPMMIGPAAIRFIKEIWGFNEKPQLVVLDPQGKESNRNALHMMWIWGNLALPFTKAKEEALWREETWRIQLLADSIDQNLLL
ncbi:hypothetical protein ACH5RR_030771 [Cinchona calisaya]|uniref:Sieve element occlusion N-terminal domain-containing protein n=1 Tax=Cinchona calisaya TaxID=153742 RepID=A0ABD2YVL1_9GENT